MTNITETKYSKRSVQYFQPEFSHIYLEDGAKNRKLTDTALSAFPHAEIIKIDNYKTVFNRPNQNIFSQQNTKKLILGIKKPPFLYKGTDILQDTHYRNLFYTTPLINCVYHCDYCFLQGMYPSANLVAFVNESDFFIEVDKGIDSREFKDEPLVLSIAYNNDLLAFENKIPYCKNWIEFARNKKNLLIEIRTKCANINSIKDIPSHSNIVFAWTLTPNEIRQRYENHTPSLDKRLDAVEFIISKGWKVRLCIDPVLYVENWDTIYGNLIDQLFSRISQEQIMDMVIGVFRMNTDYFHRIRKQKPKSDLFYQNWNRSNGIVEPKKNIQAEIITEIKKMIKNYIPMEKVHFWKNEQ